MRNSRLAVGMAWVAMIALVSGVGGCKKKPADKSGGGAGMADMMAAGPAMAGAMDTEPGMRAAPMRPAEPVKRPVAKLKASDPAAVKLLDAAIGAHGGLEALKSKTVANTTEVKGKFYGVPYTAKNVFVAPDKMLMDIVSMKATMGYIGAECWSRLHEVVVDCDPAEKKTAQEMQLVTYWALLHPLKGEGFSLQPAQTPKVDGKETEGFTAAHPKTALKVTFGFFKKTKLLASMSYAGHWSGGKKGIMTTSVLAYKKFDGLQMPSKSVMKFGDKVIIEEEITKLTWGKVDDKIFARPKQVEMGKGILRKIDAYQAAFTVHKGDYKGLAAKVGTLFAFLGKNKLAPMGPPVFVYLKMGANPTKYVAEIRVALAPFKGAAPKAEGFGVKKVPAVLHALAYVKGPYTSVGPKYKALGEFVKKSKKKVAGPAHMMGLSNPATTKPADLLNRISFPVK